MLSPLHIACIQNNAGTDPQKNIAVILKKVDFALKRKAKLIALPENFYWRGAAKDMAYLARRVTPVVISQFRTRAKKYRVAFLLGSVLESAPGKNKFYNTSILISGTGKVLARYRKIHLFDVALKNVKVRESRHIVSGAKVVTARIHGIKAGLTICYDLRFPELFRALSKRGAQLIFVPSNFTETTGKAHWEVLLRARAIENLAFIAAPAQSGKNPDSGLKSFGTSLIIDPWGRVLARGSRTGQEVIIADLDFEEQSRLRRALPALKHRRL